MPGIEAGDVCVARCAVFVFMAVLYDLPGFDQGNQGADVASSLALQLN
jgi:hypothetical protein